MAHLVAHLIYREILVLFQVRIKLGPWIGMSYRDLNRFAVKLLGKLEGALDGLGRLPWQPDDKIAMHHDAQPLAVLHKRSGLFDGRTFLDILKNLRIARLKAHNQQAAPCIFHGFERLVVCMHARGTRPGLLQGLQCFTQRQRAPLPPGKGVIVKEDLPQVREEYLHPSDFSDDIGNAACAPGMAADGLWPQAEGAQRWATARGIKRDIGMEQKRDIILRDIEV